MCGFGKFLLTYNNQIFGMQKVQSFLSICRQAWYITYFSVFIVENGFKIIMMTLGVTPTSAPIGVQTLAARGTSAPEANS